MARPRAVLFTISDAGGSWSYHNRANELTAMHPNREQKAHGDGSILLGENDDEQDELGHTVGEIINDLADYMAR